MVRLYTPGRQSCWVWGSFPEVRVQTSSLEAVVTQCRGTFPSFQRRPLMKQSMVFLLTNSCILEILHANYQTFQMVEKVTR